MDNLGSSQGQVIVDLALKHLGESYLYGILVPKDDADYIGPWDCAEFCSWILYQVAGVLYGTDQHWKPSTADAYTGYWLRDMRTKGRQVSVQVACCTPGAFILRYGVPGLGAHIVISDGHGGTVEAHSHLDGVMQGKITPDRHFNYGILPSGVDYNSA